MPSEQQLLTIWERTLAAKSDQWAIELLQAFFAELPAGAVEDLDIVERDLLLLHVRGALFGTRLTCRVDCPECGERLEWQVDSDRLGVSDPGHRYPGGSSPILSTTIDGTDILFRRPTTRDIACVKSLPDPEQCLIQRCVLAASRDGHAVPDILSRAHLERVAAELQYSAAEALPAFELECPDCGCSFSSPLDILSFLRSELGAWVRRLLQTVHQLASNYGWSETDILAMHPARRSAYLGLVNS